MLKHPLVYRSCKARLDTLQKHYVPKEKRVNFHHTVYVNCPSGPHKYRGGCHLGTFKEPCFSIVPPSSPLPVIVTV